MMITPFMRSLRRVVSWAMVGCVGLAVEARAAELIDLWNERVKSVAAVEFFVENELDRRLVTTPGVVIDRDGTIILPPGVVNGRAQPTQLKDFKVYRPGQPVTEYTSAEYLGPDAITGFHFIRMAEAGRKQFVPVTEFAQASAAVPAVTETVWGIALRSKDEDFRPFFLQSAVSLRLTMPQVSVCALASVTGPNLPAFNREGVFVGLGMGGFGESFYEYSRTERGSSITLVRSDETRVFRCAAEVLPYLGRIPKSQFGRPLSWLGTYGLQPIDPEVAKFLKLEGQAALVVSEALEESPAAKAGLKDRDVIVAVNGQALPSLKPDRVVALWLDQEVARRQPGEVMKLTILRGSERIELPVTLGDEPKTWQEAERKFFERIGVSAREFVYSDAVFRRVKQAEAAGVVAHFVKNNSPAATGGLRGDDWIKQIDGVEVKTYAEAVAQLAAIEADVARVECVLQISRTGETSVVRVKLK